MLVLCLVAVSAQAQGIRDTMDIQARKAERRIRPGDQLAISVYGHDELPKAVRVEGDGSIKYPFMKDIKVEGLTIEQMANVLGVRLSQYIGGRAEVVVSFAEDETIEVVVLGQVRNPGAHKMPLKSTIQGALSIAGGATERSDLDETKLIRRNPETGLREEFEVALESIIIETGDIERLPQLRDGDIIFVPAIYGAVYANVLGAVRKPGNYELFPGANVVDVVFLAGGPSDDASIRNIKLIRRIGAAQTEQVVDIEQVLRAKGGQVPLVEPGDIIFVPARKFTVKMFFQVVSYTASILTLIFLYLQVKNR
jgi:protein involved in polysaccharide export with SLBB domain